MFCGFTMRAAIGGAIAALGLTATVVPAVAAAPAVPAGATARDGAAWRVAYAGDRPAYDALNAVVATGPSNAWAFGSSRSSDGRFAPIARHWTGRSWAGATLPAGLERGVNVARATGPHNVWAFAGGDEGGEAYALRWNGHHWRVEGTWPAFEYLTGAAVVNARDVWVFGGSRIGPGIGTWHFDGTSWTETDTPVATLSRASAVTARDIWAVGTDHDGYDVVARWNGHEWTRVDVPGLPREEDNAVTFSDVHATSSHDVWVVGSEYRNDGDGFSETPLALHFDGHGWRRLDPPGQGRLSQVTSDRRGGVWAVPQVAEPYDAPELLHFTHGRWTGERQPRPEGRVAQVYDVAPVPSGGSVWAAGRMFPADDEGTSDAVIWVRGRLT